jgi:site-specific recombinase XerD
MNLDSKKLAEAKAEYLMDCRITGKSWKTVEHYSSVIDLFLKRLGDDEISHRSIKKYLARVSETRRITTVSTYCRTLRTFCNFLVREGYLEEDPMANIRTPKIPRRFPFVLSDQDLSELIRVSRKNPRDHAIVLFLLDTGVRAGELVGMKVDDADLSRGQAKVFGKGGKERIVFFSRTTAKALAKWLSVRPRVPYEDALFMSQRKGPLTVNGLNQVIKRLHEKAGLSGKVSTHRLRSCFAKLFIEAGGDSHSLARLMGHESIMMAEVYVHMVGKDLERCHRRCSPVARLEGGVSNKGSW